MLHYRSFQTKAKEEDDKEKATKASAQIEKSNQIHLTQIQSTNLTNGNQKPSKIVEETETTTVSSTGNITHTKTKKPFFILHPTALSH